VTARLHPQKLARAAAWYRLHHKTDQAERLEQMLVVAGRCKVCGRLLSRQDSIEIGIGPECLSRISQQRPRRAS
jgi:hypothetical protein